MQYITETYRAEGWTEDAPKIMSERAIEYIRLACADRRLSEEDVLAAADAALGLDAAGGPWHGQCRVKRIDDWQWFMGWRKVRKESIDGI